MAQLREAGGANSLVLALVQPKGGLQKTEEIILFLLILQVGISDCFWLDGGQSAEGEQQICLTPNQQQCWRLFYYLYFLMFLMLPWRQQGQHPCLCQPCSHQQQKKKSPNINPCYHTYFLLCSCSHDLAPATADISESTDSSDFAALDEPYRHCRATFKMLLWRTTMFKRQKLTSETTSW